MLKSLTLILNGAEVPFSTGLSAKLRVSAQAIVTFRGRTVPENQIAGDRIDYAPEASQTWTAPRWELWSQRQVS